MHAEQKSLPAPVLWALAILLALVWFGPLDYRFLVRPDEGRYAEIPLEMLVSGDWITPRLNGLKYFEKPPLQYWGTALAYSLFGVSEWTSRLWTALTGFCTVLMVYFTANCLFAKPAGLVAAATLAATPFMVVGGQFNTLDMGFSSCLSLALCSLLLAHGPSVSPISRRNWMLVFWAALALATLSKGPVAVVLMGGAIVVYTLVARDLSLWRHGHFLLGVPLYLAMVLPWFIAVGQANPEFFDFFFIHEHVERFLTKSHGRYRPVWYFLPILLLGLLPWTGLYLRSLVMAWKTRSPGAFQPLRLLLAWVLLVFLFFSASSSKLPAYILPIIPAMALLVGATATQLTPKGLQVHLGVAVILAFAGLLAPPFLGRVGGDAVMQEALQAYRGWIMAGAGVLLLGAVAGFALARHQRTLTALLVLCGTSAPAFGLLVAGTQVFHTPQSSAGLILPIRDSIPADAAFFMLHRLDQTVPFYLGRPVTLVEVGDELSFGLQQEPERAIATQAAFVQRWQQAPAAFAIMPSDHHATLVQQGLPMAVVARNPYSVLVRKP